MREVSSRNKEGQKHAFNSTSGNSGSGGCPAVAGKSLHPHAGIHKVDSQRRCSHRRSVVAAERIRALSLADADPRRNSPDPIEQVSHNAERVTQIYQLSAAGSPVNATTERLQ